MNTKENFINEVTLRYSRKRFSLSTITDSEQAHKFAVEMYGLAQAQIDLKEYFFIILLNKGHEVIGFHKLSEGGISSTVVDMRLAYATALKTLASGMILVHNHPSGQLKASPADIEITAKFKKFGALANIEVYDHIILSGSGYLSFADDGLLARN